MSDCPFCNYGGPSEILRERWVSLGAHLPMRVAVFTIEPLDPVTKGHLLVVPREHVRDFRDRPWVLAAVMKEAAEVAGEIIGGCNLIVSAGHAATQTVPHFHVHVIPRREYDGLCLPWSREAER